MKCPHCGKFIIKNLQKCPYCHLNIPSNVNPVYNFLKDNAPFLAIIGLIGTMLALMPTFLNSIANSVWIGEQGFSGFIIMVMAILSVIFFLILIILLITEAITNQDRLPILGLLFIFFIFLFGIIFFIFFTINRYYWANFIINYALIFFLLPILTIIVIALWESGKSQTLGTNIPYRNKKNRLFYKVTRRWWAMRDVPQKQKNTSISIQRIREWISQLSPSLTIIFYLAVVIAICSGFWLVLAFVFDISNQNVNIQSNQKNISLIQNFEKDGQIISDSNYYYSYIPNSYGLGLTYSHLSELPTQNISDYTFNWKTNYGYFIRWIPTEQRILYLSNTTAQSGIDEKEKILWTYNPNDIKIINENVTISLTIQNKTGYYVANKTFNLGWIDKNIIQVQN